MVNSFLFSFKQIYWSNWLRKSIKNISNEQSWQKIRYTNSNVRTLQKGVPVGFHKMAIYHYNAIYFIYW